MKKTVLLLMAVLLPSMMFAQLKVDNNGRVMIKAPSSTGGIFNVESNSDFTYAQYLHGKNHGLEISLENQSTDTSAPSMGLFITTKNRSDVNHMGIMSNVTNLSTSNYSAAVIGRASGSCSGRVFGVCGSLSGTVNGAGIYGGIGSIYNYEVDGRYAGYFRGNMKVTGTIDGTLVSSSDARLKEDVQPLGDNAMNRGVGVLQILESLNPVSFKYKQLDEKKEALPTGDGEDAVEEEKLPNPVMEKEHFGLIAQELQEIYPNLVYEKDNGYLAVNYTELVPVLMQAIKELNAKVEQLEAGKASHSPLLREGGVRGGSETASAAAMDFADAASMDQNVPNPFTEKTDIAIYLPESVKTATLYIYDLSGKQIEQHPIAGRGDTVMTIHAERMDAGMYVYSLIADKKVVTTRKMIVVK